MKGGDSSGDLALPFAAARENRRRLAAMLGDHLVVLEGREAVVRSNDVEYPFRQHSDFLSLTGYAEPGAVFALAGRDEVLFVPKPNERWRVWLGDLPTPKELKASGGFRRVHYLQDFDRVLRRMLRGRREVLATGKAVGRLYRLRPNLKFKAAPLARGLKAVRAVKTDLEIALMRRAAEASSAAHVLAMAKARPGLCEYQLQSFFEKELLFHGLVPSYPPIVAAGSNAAVLHYFRNTAVMRSGQMLLLDAAENARVTPLTSRAPFRWADASPAASARSMKSCW